jgi:putative flippase GtrA
MLQMFSRYFAIQVGAYVLDLGTFFLLARYAGTGPLYANAAGKVVAGAVAFFAHRHITFEAHGQGNMRGQALRYVALLGLNIPLSSAVLAVLLHFIAWPPAAKVASDGICLGLTFLLSRHLVFTAPGGKGGA